MKTGRVVDFDEAAGLGTVEGDDGRRFRFHCTQIADGSRRIDVGARVGFVVRAARQGTWEAQAVGPAGPLSPADPAGPVAPAGSVRR